MAFIEAKDYRFFYPDEVTPAVSVEQMEIKQGTITLLVGPSGCGKTTLLRKLAGETGIRGREEGSLTNQAKGCAYVWQNPDNQIVTDRVSYEIVFGLENIGMEQQQMKRRLAEVISSFGLENLVTRDTMTLSGGEKQLLNIASGLAMNPELMILDERQIHTTCRRGKNPGCHVVLHSEKRQIIIFWMSRPKEWMQNQKRYLVRF